MKRKIKLYGVTVFLSIFVVMVLIASFCVGNTTNNATATEEVVILEPTKTEEKDSETDRFTFELNNIDETNNTLVFYTNHQEAFVYAEDKLIYSLVCDDSIFGRTPGAKWNILNLPLDVDTITVEIRQVYTQLDKYDVEFQLGSAIIMQRDVIINSVFDVCVALSIMLIGFALFLYWALVFRNTGEQRDVLYLGLFAAVFGVWAFGETKLAVYMYQNRAFWSYMAFTCLQTMCLPFVYFTKHFLEMKDKYLHKVIAGYIVIEAVVAQLLHLTGILSVKETVVFTMINIIAAIAYLMVGIFSAIKHGREKRKIIVNIIGLIAIVITSIADMGGYFINVSESNQLGKLGFLIYAIILGEEVARDAFIRVQESNKMAIYKEMAVKDMPTGCYNRNAYSEDIQNLAAQKGIYVITFDLNNLKRCNDTRGHMAGDKYILDAAQMIKDIFGGFGRIYRIGGDEFCILARNISEKMILDRRDVLRKAIVSHREKYQDEDFGISCGYASYDAENDKDIEETRHRADLSMYENKKELKA